MVRITDWPAAHAGAKVHEADRNRSEERLPIVAVLLIIHVMASSILPCLHQSAIGRGSANRALCFAHFDAATRSLAVDGGENRGQGFCADSLHIATPQIIGDASEKTAR